MNFSTNYLLTIRVYHRGRYKCMSDMDTFFLQLKQNKDYIMYPNHK